MQSKPLAHFQGELPLMQDAKQCKGVKLISIFIYLFIFKLTSFNLAYSTRRTISIFISIDK